ncbi:MAG: universal stress protein [Acidimicrobiia bacterium]|nr:universal stress protein [Acidimicrobiia bacterium]
MPYRNVVVGTDGSETAELAVRHAAELAVAFRARLTIVTAFSSQPEQEAKRLQAAPADVRWAITDAASADERARRARSIARGAGVDDVVLRVDDGDPAALLIDAADDSGADVIVVGSKGMTSAKRFVLGSVPNKVSHHAPCDVIIVHTAP